MDIPRLKIKFSKLAEMSEQPFATKLGIPVSPPDFVDCSCLIAFQTLPTKAEVIWSLRSDNGDFTTSGG